MVGAAVLASGAAVSEAACAHLCTPVHVETHCPQTVKHSEDSRPAHGSRGGAGPCF